jgi:hypothetical protein
MGTVRQYHIHDYDESSRIDGNKNREMLVLYHYGIGQRIELVVNGREFLGYDH